MWLEKIIGYFPVPLSASLCMFPCGKKPFVKAYLNNLVTIILNNLTPLIKPSFWLLSSLKNIMTEPSRSVVDIVSTNSLSMYVTVVLWFSKSLINKQVVINEQSLN